MPTYGLTQEMREARPWGLDPQLLQTKKVITDPVHGDIFLTELERQVIDSRPFQRLRRVRQLGTTHLVYPGATHNRFAHSLGSLAMAQRLMDAVLDQELGPHPEKHDLFSEWRTELGYGTDTFDAVEYARRTGEATVLARLGALLHDFTHIPFGHSLEDDLELLTSHDANVERFDRLWAQFDTEVRDRLSSEGLADFLRPLVVSRAGENGADKEIPKIEIAEERAREIPRAEDRQRWYDFVRDIIGNTICADLLDYLHRDHLFTGLPFAVGDRYLAYFYVTPIRGEVHYPARMVLRIQREGQERPDVVTELLKHLRYRYELSERALVHHAKLAADAMVGKALEMWTDALWRDLALAKLGEDEDARAESDITRLKKHFADVRSGPAADSVTERMQEAVEREVARRSDDSFLEWLRDETAAEADKPDTDKTKDRRKSGINTLAQELLDRQLYKRIGVQGEVPISAKAFYERYGVKDRRREVEQDAADYANVDRSWKVLTWIPAHEMRLKVAGVLVNTGAEIQRFVDHERRGDERGADIYKSHEHLWAVHVFVHRSVSLEQREVILARLAAQMGIRFAALEDKLGKQPADWPDLLAAHRACAKRPEAKGRVIELFQYIRTERAARGPEPARFGLLQAEYDEAAKTFFKRS